MTDQSISALLLDAKREYMLRLLEICLPPVSSTIQGLFVQAMDQGGNTNGLYLFQQSLRTIPSWNQNVVQDKTTEITSKFPYVDDLIAACIVTQVKIMSSIRLSSDRPNIRLNLPTTTEFVHQLYIQTAKRVYEDPFVMVGAASAAVALEAVVNDALERTVRKMIPFQDVLQAYLQAGGETATAARAVATATSSESSDFKNNKKEEESESEDDDEDNEDNEDNEEDEDIQVPLNGPIPQNIVQPPVQPQPRPQPQPQPQPQPPTQPPTQPHAPAPQAPAQPPAQPPVQPQDLFGSGSASQLRQGF
jgi:hypothetical protein